MTKSPPLCTTCNQPMAVARIVPVPKQPRSLSGDAHSVRHRPRTLRQWQMPASDGPSHGNHPARARGVAAKITHQRARAGRCGAIQSARGHIIARPELVLPDSGCECGGLQSSSSQGLIGAAGPVLPCCAGSFFANQRGTRQALLRDAIDAVGNGGHFRSASAGVGFQKDSLRLRSLRRFIPSKAIDPRTVLRWHKGSVVPEKIADQQTDYRKYDSDDDEHHEVDFHLLPCAT
jgi:hypothetical protein